MKRAAGHATIARRYDSSRAYLWPYKTMRPNEIAIISSLPPVFGGLTTTHFPQKRTLLRKSVSFSSFGATRRKLIRVLFCGVFRFSSFYFLFLNSIEDPHRVISMTELIIHGQTSTHPWGRSAGFTTALSEEGRDKASRMAFHSHSELWKIGIPDPSTIGHFSTAVRSRKSRGICRSGATPAIIFSITVRELSH